MKGRLLGTVQTTYEVNLDRPHDMTAHQFLELRKTNIDASEQPL